MKISQLFLGLVACSTAFAYAGIDGISSNESNIKIGAAANASHPGGVQRCRFKLRVRHITLLQVLVR